ncbi:MAG TPA: signal peptide peptidase SppA [Vicinamibacterales bacterium]|nr:signal peptide peptidase SppA [Vicinamibacterales bacterium]
MTDVYAYPRVIAWAKRQPWAVRREIAALIKDLLTRRALGLTVSLEQLDARLASSPPAAARPAAQRRGTIAILPLNGIIAHRANLLVDVSGGTSTERFAAEFRAAVEDPAVDAIVLDVDSPGGGVYGVPELADEIFAARGRKPIVAVANAEAASAAYWIASAADELVVTPSGQVGSIGVYMLHEDFSGALEQDGVSVTLVSAGEYKTEGNPFEPLSDEGRAYWQRVVDSYYDQFVRAVARGRGVTQTEVREGFGQGRMVTAKEAERLGMVDRVETLPETLTRLAGRLARGGRARAEGEAEVDLRRRRQRLQELA